MSQPEPSQPEAEHESHGHSIAAWSSVGILLLGAAVMSFAVLFPSVLWFIVGVVICVIGAIAGKVLAMAGYGAKAVTHTGAHRNGAEEPGHSKHNSGTA